MEDAQQLLEGLQAMKSANPAAFQQAMQSLGLPVGGDGDGLDFEDEGSLLQMTDAIKKMRAEQPDGAAANGVNMSKDVPKQPKGITITPTAGFTYKTSRFADGMKVFINMAQHEAIDEPGMKKKLNENGEEIEGMNIPMSVGAPRSDQDKKGEACIVYDIIVNPVVVKEATADKTGKYRDFICQLGMQYLEQKYKEDLDKRYKLPKLKYMGPEIVSQYIQDRKAMPKIEEVSSSNNTSTGKTKNGEVGTKQGESERMKVEVIDKELEYTCHWLEVNTNTAEQDGNEDSHGIKCSSNENGLEYLPDTTTLDMEYYHLTPYNHSLVEYIDPVHEPPNTLAATKAIVLRMEYESYQLTVPQDARIVLSPYRVHIKLPGYKKVICHLACAIQPACSYYTLQRPYEGCVSKVALELLLRIDARSWDEHADAGSKPWLMAQALSTTADEATTAAVAGANAGGHADKGVSYNPYLDEYSNSMMMHGVNLRKQNTAGDGGSGSLSVEESGGGFAEDRFHLKLPDNVDQYTGLPFDEAVGVGGTSSTQQQDRKASEAEAATRETVEEQELPEDRFHARDAGSAYHIQQREQSRKDKWDKHEKEKAERANDPNVEYVDMDDFIPGGKYEPQESKDAREKEKQSAAGQAHTAKSEELRRAAQFVATQASGGVGINNDGGTVDMDMATADTVTGGGDGIITGASSSHASGVGALGLQSTLWTELLD
mmetsp:Transcript_24890/g.41478  ORF Transcript_24890/g.41478 Transcript_24890/m.41478 type:complete len:714 (-) Transcript_24890:90-2231(-)